MNTQKLESGKQKQARLALACFLISVFCFLSAAPAAATTVSGTLKKPDGTPVTGTLEFALSQAAKTTTPPVTFAPVKTTCVVTAGEIAAGCVVQGNDTLDPAGTFYRVRVVDTNNVVVMPSANYTFSGASVDFGSLPTTATDTLLPPTGSVTGNLNVTGNLTVGGTASFGADPQSFVHLRLLGQTADPASATSGSVFHRSDLNRIRFRVGGLEVFDGTDYLPLTTPSSGTIDVGANFTVSGTRNAAFKRMNQIRLVDPNLWTESGVTAKIDAADDDCGGTACLLVLPSNLGSGEATDASWDEDTGILDLRQGAASYGGAPAKGPLKLYQRKTTDTGAAEHFAPLWLGQQHFSGGVNGATKTTYWALAATTQGFGQGQDYLLGGNLSKQGNGDAIGLNVSVVSGGNCLAGGDECLEGLRSNSIQDNAVFTATISTAVDNGATWTITYSSAVNDNRRGETRYLINTNAAKIYTTGTVSSISSANPPVVTGSGTSWQTQFGAGAHTDLCFSQNDDDNGALKFVVPVSSVGSETSLTLNTTAAGATTVWRGDNNGSSYRIYYCSQAASLGAAGSLTVNEGATNWAAADTIEMPLGYAFVVVGARITYNLRLPDYTSSNGLDVENQGSRSVAYGIQLGGKHERGLNFAGTWVGSAAGGAGVTTGINFASAPSVGIGFPTAQSTLLRVSDSTGGTTGNADLTYNSTSDQYAFTLGSTSFIFGMAGGTFQGPNLQANTKFTLNSNPGASSAGSVIMGTGTVPSATTAFLKQTSGNGGVPFWVSRNQANSATINLLTYSTSDTLDLAQAGTLTKALGNFESAGSVQGTQLISTVATGTAPLSVSSTTGVANLNADKLDGQDAPAGTLVGTTDTQTLSNKTLQSPTLSVGVAANGSGFKHSRVSTGSISAGSSAAVTLTWTTAFADASYTVNCSLIEATASTSTLRIHHLESVIAASVVVRVVNDDGAAAHTGTLHCVSVHD